MKQCINEYVIKTKVGTDAKITRLEAKKLYAFDWFKFTRSLFQLSFEVHNSYGARFSKKLQTFVISN